MPNHLLKQYVNGLFGHDSFMKVISTHLVFIGLLFSSLVSFSQPIPLFTENFNANTCTSQGTCYADSYVGLKGAWTVTPGTNGGFPNKWFVSPFEAGANPGQCGKRNVSSTNGTLHISSTVDQYNNFNPQVGGLFPCTTGDCGASYFTGLMDGSVITDQRVESPTIDCSNANCTVYLTFNYIENGDGTNDNMTVEYSPDNGATWMTIADPPNTDTCTTAAGEGIWKKYKVALPGPGNSGASPGSACQNPNVKIGFRWVNNDDGAGNDPAIAIDSVLVYTTLAPEPPNMLVTPAISQCVPATFNCSLSVVDTNFFYIWDGWKTDITFDTTFTQPTPPLGFIITVTFGNYIGCGPTNFGNYVYASQCTVPVVSFSPGDTTICASKCINFTNKSLASGTPTYTWTFQGGNPASYTGVTPPQVCFDTPSPTGQPYQVTLTVKDGNGNTASSTHNITVNLCNGPVADFSVSKPNPICAGSSLTFTSSSLNAKKWDWSFQGGNPSTFNDSMPPAIAFADTGNFIVSLTVSDVNGNYPNTKTYTVRVDSCKKPKVNFTASNTNPCAGDCIQFTDASTGNPTTWAWSFPNATPTSSSQQSPGFVCYSASGKYDVKLKVANPNGEDSLTISNYINVFDLPTAGINIDSISIIGGTTVDLSATGGKTYSWYPNLYISSDTGSTVTVFPPDSTVYTVTVKDENGCTAQRNVIVRVLPEKEIFVPTLFTPNNDRVNDYFKPYMIGNVIQYQFTVFDRWGTEIFFTDDPNRAWTGMFNGKDCPVGVYVWFYKVKFYDGKEFTAKGDVSLMR